MIRHLFAVFLMLGGVAVADDVIDRKPGSAQVNAPYFVLANSPLAGEHSALSTFSWQSQKDRYSVGAAMRAYGSADGVVWAAVTEAYSSRLATEAHLLGIENSIVSRSPHASNSVKWAVNAVFKNRMDDETAAGGVGSNFYNANSVALMVTSQSRSTDGEYAGFQTAIKLDRVSLDRDAYRPYAAVIDVADVQTAPDVPVYLVVYKCGASRCGIKLVEGALEVWKDIGTNPTKLRAL